MLINTTMNTGVIQLSMNLACLVNGNIAINTSLGTVENWN
jgi:hypothetical protein